MRCQLKKILWLSLALGSSSMAAVSDVNGFTQAIHVVNLLSNDTLEDPGMTSTGIVIKYYNGSNSPCWSSTLFYQQDGSIHAGPTQGCKAKVTRVEVIPMLVADKLKTYQGPLNINIDTSKFASQITVFQDQPPTFDYQSGLVSVSGTMRARVQAQYKN